MLIHPSLLLIEAIFLSYYRETARHNTLTIMSKTIPDDSMKGKLLQLTTKTDEATSYDVLVTENPTYTVSGEKHLNLTHRRSVFFVNQKFFVIVDEGYDTTADHNSNINVNFHLFPIENASSDVVIDEGQKYRTAMGQIQMFFT